MKLLFCTSDLPGSVLIRAITWSKWSHVAIVDGDDVIEAVWPRVRISRLADVLAKHPSYVLVDVETPFNLAIIKAARSQVFKPYDFTALFGILAHRDWEQSDAWFCSELVSWAFGQGGLSLFREDALHRITPQDLWKLAPSLFQTPK